MDDPRQAVGEPLYPKAMELDSSQFGGELPAPGDRQLYFSCSERWNAHGVQPPGDRGAIRGVAVTDEVARCLIPWECFGDLLGDPLGGWICCHIGPDEPSPLQTQDDQPIEQFEPDRRNDEQIDTGDVAGVIA